MSEQVWTKTVVEESVCPKDGDRHDWRIEDESPEVTAYACGKCWQMRWQYRMQLGLSGGVDGSQDQHRS